MVAGEVGAGTRLRQGAVVVNGNVEGSIQFGDHNLLVHDNHGTIVVEKVEPTRKRRPPAPPPRPPEPFVAREAELSRLGAAIGARRGITVSGEAGAGRTALLRAVANAKSAALPDGVLRLDGTDAAGQALSINDLAQRLHDAAWDCVPVAKVTLESARAELGRIEALLMADDISLSDADLGRLSDLMPAGAVLITTGPPPMGGDLEDVPVGALDRRGAAALLAARAGIDPVVGAEPEVHAHLDAICELLSDWPEALVLAGRAMAARGMSPDEARATLATAPTSTATPHFVALQRAYALARPGLDSDALLLLVTASALPGRTHDAAVLRRMLGEPVWFEEAAETLIGLGLLTLNSPRYRIPDGILAQVGTEAVARALNVRDDYINIALASAKERTKDPGFVVEELGGLLGAFEWAMQKGRFRDGIQLGRLIAPWLVLTGLWDAWRRVAQGIRAAAQQVGADADLAWAAHELGTRELALGDRRAAIDLLREALQIRRRLGDRQGAAYTSHNLRWLGIGPGDGWFRRLGLGGGILAITILVLLAAPTILAGIQGLWPSAATPTGMPLSESPRATEATQPSLDPLVVLAASGDFRFDGQDWATTLQITLSGGRGDYLVTLDGIGESRENPSSFEIFGTSCELRRVIGTASSAAEQETPIAIDVGPSDCPATPVPLEIACVTFDDIEVGKQFGEIAGNQPGDEIYQTADGIRVSVHDFLYSDEGGTFNDVTIREPSSEFGSGPYVWFNNVNLEFDFTGLPFVTRRADFVFRDSGGNQNVSVNLSEIYRQLLVEAPSPIGGVSWDASDADEFGTRVGTLNGTVEQFLVGGQELALDTVCAHAAG
jgi:hypothetical protein